MPSFLNSKISPFNLNNSFLVKNIPGGIPIKKGGGLNTRNLLLRIPTWKKLLKKILRMLLKL